MSTAVVILNWNGIHFLKQFLPAVVRHSEGADIVVIDNASTDDSLKFLSSEFPLVKQVHNKENSGFAGGYNEGLKQVSADYFILLNSDVEVTEGWISPVIGMMEKDHRISACQPKILSHADRSSFEYAGAAGGYIDRYGYPFCRGRIFDKVEKDSGQYDDARKIFWATGACMFVRASAFRAAGGFDEKFFAHMEEIDLCWRLQKAGGTVWYCPDSTVYHVGGGTLHKSNPRKTYLNFRNNLLMLYKNLPAKEFESVFSFRLLFDFLAAGKSIAATRNILDTQAIWRAHRDFRKMKREIQSAVYSGDEKKSMEDVVYPKSIVKDYFLRGKKTFSSLGF